VVKCIETENRIMAPEVGEGEGIDSYCLMCVEFLFYKMKLVLFLASARDQAKGPMHSR
jgi:hypothetical protein